MYLFHEMSRGAKSALVSRVSFHYGKGFVVAVKTNIDSLPRCYHSPAMTRRHQVCNFPVIEKQFCNELATFM
jgi:hypothetical protein